MVTYEKKKNSKYGTFLANFVKRKKILSMAHFWPTLEKFVVPSMKILLYVLPSSLVRFYNYLSKVLRLTVVVDGWLFIVRMIHIL